MKEDFYILLIQKQLSGNITPDENDQLKAWLSNSESNQKVYDDLLLAWDHLPIEKIESETDKEWQKLDAKIQKKNNTRTIRMAPILGIAASLLLLVSAFIWINNDKGVSVIAPQDGYVSTLPDGTSITLKKGSELAYSDDYNTNRTVQITGEALLNVTHNPERPFQVVGADITVTVLGTEFIFADREKDNRANVQLIDGKVSVLSNSSKANYTLLPQEQYLLTPDTEKKVSSIKLKDYSWYQPNYEFDDVALSKVLDLISKYEGIKVTATEINSCRFTGNLTGMNLTQIVANISALYNADTKDGEGAYVIIGGDCQ